MFFKKEFIKIINCSSLYIINKNNFFEDILYPGIKNIISLIYSIV